MSHALMIVPRALTLKMSRFLRTQRLFSTVRKSSPVTENPLNLNKDLVDQTYSIPHGEVKSYFSQGFPRNLHKQGETLGKVTWILRNQTWNVIDSLNQGTSTNNGFVFYGPDRCGKTVSLLQVVHSCLRNQWIVVHIPSVFAWVHPKSEFKPAKQPGTYDVPNESCSWLQYFRSMNTKQLGQIKLSQSYAWTKKEQSSEGEDILKAIEYGIIRPNVATDVVHCVFNEMAKLNSHKVLLAVDDFNGCFVSNSLKLSKTEWVGADKIMFIKHLLDHVDPKKFGGPVVTALSKRLLRNHHYDTYAYEALLGTEGMNRVKDFKALEFSRFTKDQAKLLLNYYNQEKLLSTTLNDKVFNELWHMSNGSPGELDKLSRSV